MVSQGENQVENIKKEEPEHSKQEKTPKEAEKPVQKKNKKGNTPDTEGITNKF